jgi:biotin carboxyl carrier protein
MFKAKVNDKLFDIVVDGDEIVVDGKKLSLDSVQVGPRAFHILHNNKGFQAEIIRHDAETKTVTLRVNSRIYSVELKDNFDVLLEKMGMNSQASGKLNTVRAPMPGLILDLKIKAGDSVNAGDPLLILEAMKMENILKSPGTGVVKELKVKKGDSVEKGQVLIEF